MDHSHKETGRQVKAPYAWQPNAFAQARRNSELEKQKGVTRRRLKQIGWAASSLGHTHENQAGLLLIAIKLHRNSDIALGVVTVKRPSRR